MATGTAAIALISSAVSVGVGVAQASTQMEISKKQYWLQMENNLNTLKDRYSNLRAALEDTMLEIDQNKSDIGSENDYLSRWQSYADNAMKSLREQGAQQYSEAASAWGNRQVAASETGRIGGSVSLLNAEGRNAVAELVGESLLLNSTEGSIGEGLQQTQQDLLTEKLNAMDELQSYEQALSQNEAAADWWNKDLGATRELMEETQEKIDEHERELEEAEKARSGDDDGNDEPLDVASSSSSSGNEYNYAGTDYFDRNGTPTKVSSKKKDDNTVTIEFTAI